MLCLLRVIFNIMIGNVWTISFNFLILLFNFIGMLGACRMNIYLLVIDISCKALFLVSIIVLSLATINKYGFKDEMLWYNYVPILFDLTLFSIFMFYIYLIV